MLSPKILHLITLSEVGGAQRACARTVLGLKSRGYQVDVACKPGGWLEDHLRAQGIRVLPLHELDRPIALSKDVETLRTGFRLIKSERYQLVHCHSTKAGVIGRIAAKFVGVPSVFTAHGWAFAEGVPAERRAIALLVEAVLAQITSRIICVSEYDRQLALRWRIAPPDRIRLIHNGIEDVGEPLGARFSYHTVRIVMIARFSAPKDHRSLLTACAIAGGDFQIILVGDGPDRAEAKQLARQLGIEQKVRFLGECSDVESVLRGADIGVLASNGEGLPISIIEYMRAGLPVVASSVGGVPELVEDGVNGFLVARGDVNMLAQRIQVLINSGYLRGKLGSTGRTLFETKFGDRRMVEQIIQLYEEILPAAHSLFA